MRQVFPCLRRIRWSALFMAFFLFLSVFVCALPALAAWNLKVSYLELAGSTSPAGDGGWSQFYVSTSYTPPAFVKVSAKNSHLLQFHFSCNPSKVPAGSVVRLRFRWYISTTGTVSPSLGTSLATGSFFGSSDGFRDYWSYDSVSIKTEPAYVYLDYTLSYQVQQESLVEGQVTFLIADVPATWQEFCIESLSVVTPDGQIIDAISSLSDRVQNMAESIVSSIDSNRAIIVANNKANTDKITANQDANTNKVIANQDKNADKLANGWDPGQMNTDTGKLSGALGELDGLQASADAGLNDALSNQTSPDLSDHTESVTFITSSAVLFWNALGPFQIVIYLILALVVFNFLSRYQSGGG